MEAKTTLLSAGSPCRRPPLLLRGLGFRRIFSGNVFNYVQIYEARASLPFVSNGGAVSASAFGGFSSIAPGTWIEIYGSNLAPDTRGWAASDFTGANAPTSLDGTKVTIGGQPAFIDYVNGAVLEQRFSTFSIGAVTEQTRPGSPKCVGTRGYCFHRQDACFPVGW